MATKLCVNCVHHRALSKETTQWCTRNAERNVHTDAVTGRVESWNEGELFCRNERALFGKDVCGPEGKFFVNKPSVLERVIAWFK